MTQFTHSREIPAAVEQIFAAFADPERHARWWGPAGFTNTFKLREFKTGGKWSYVMHGPDGRDYPNESVFVEVIAPKKVVIDHTSLPKYRLTIELAPSEKGTRLSWLGVFENETFATNAKDFLNKANEENIDRLVAEVLG